MSSKLSKVRQKAIARKASLFSSSIFIDPNIEAQQKRRVEVVVFISKQLHK